MFYPSAAGNVLRYQQNDIVYLVGRDKNAAGNIADYSPFLYNATVAAGMRKRLEEGINPSQSRKKMLKYLGKNRMGSHYSKAFQYESEEEKTSSSYDYYFLIQLHPSDRKFILECYTKSGTWMSAPPRTKWFYSMVKQLQTYRNPSKNELPKYSNYQVWHELLEGDLVLQKPSTNLFKLPDSEILDQVYSDKMMVSKIIPAYIENIRAKLQRLQKEDDTNKFPIGNYPYNSIKDFKIISKLVENKKSTDLKKVSQSEAPEDSVGEPPP